MAVITIAAVDGPHSHFYAAWTSRHEPSMIPKALKFANLQKKMAPGTLWCGMLGNGR